MSEEEGPPHTHTHTEGQRQGHLCANTAVRPVCLCVYVCVHILAGCIGRFLINPPSNFVVSREPTSLSTRYFSNPAAVIMDANTAAFFPLAPHRSSLIFNTARKQGMFDRWERISSKVRVMAPFFNRQFLNYDKNPQKQQRHISVKKLIWSKFRYFCFLTGR